MCPRTLAHLRKKRSRKRNPPVKESQVVRKKYLKKIARRKKTEE
jgi:hypothetical protein